MSTTRNQTVSISLAANWRRWTQTVNTFAQGWNHQRLNPQEYEKLRQDLLDSCQVWSEKRPDGPYREMAALVQPRISLQALKHGDLIILADVVKRCRQLQSKLDGNRWIWGRRLWPAMAYFLLLVTGAGLAAWLTAPWHRTIVEMGQRVLNESRSFGNDWGANVWLATVGVLVTALAIGFAARSEPI